MKKIYALLLLVNYITAQAQVPQGINYQAIARDSQGMVLQNQAIQIQLTIHDGIPTGNISYQETDNDTTNEFGLFTLVIGSGNVTSGAFNAINWQGGKEFLNVQFSPGNGGFYDMGTTQLVSVPYSLYAQRSDTAVYLINQSQSASLVPPGSIMAYGGISAPAGWLLCDGLPHDSATFPNLFAAIGYNFGGSAGSFRLPDFRGRFLRGVDSTATAGDAGNDPDRYLRTAMSTGGSTGNNVGSVQSDTLKNHNHSSSWFSAFGYVQDSGGGGVVYTPNGPTGSSTGSYGGSETRPKNVYVNYIIKY